MDVSALRQRVIDSLLDQIRETEYPSVTMMNRVEAALSTEEELAEYAEVLVDKALSTRHPSTEMLNRIDAVLAQLG